ncbi:hypothetical protein BD414DRAFT_480477 [Trametes punicea]|nr:hypothetical protein BD414DRAFT_480477 [Trametes punicea]
MADINPVLFAHRGLQAIKDDPRCRYWAGKSSQRWPPILYPPDKVGDKKYIFRNPTIWKALRPMLYGESALQEGHKPRSHTNGMRWQIRSVSFGMIAWGATVVRFFLSGDDALEPTGKLSGIRYMADFDTWVERLIMSQDSPSIQALLEQMEKFLLGNLPQDLDSTDDPAVLEDDDNDGWDRLEDPESDHEVEDAGEGLREYGPDGTMQDNDEELAYVEYARPAAPGTITHRPATPAGVPHSTSFRRTSQGPTILDTSSSTSMAYAAPVTMSVDQAPRTGSSGAASAVSIISRVESAGNAPSMDHAARLDRMAPVNSGITPTGLVVPEEGLERTARSTAPALPIVSSHAAPGARTVSSTASYLTASVPTEAAPPAQSLRVVPDIHARAEHLYDGHFAAPTRNNSPVQEGAIIERMHGLRVTSVNANTLAALGVIGDDNNYDPLLPSPPHVGTVTPDAVNSNVETAASSRRQGRGRGSQNRARGTSSRRVSARNISPASVPFQTEDVLNGAVPMTRDDRPARTTRSGAAGVRRI